MAMWFHALHDFALQKLEVDVDVHVRACAGEASGDSVPG
jgi:hypothetical protein